KQYIYYSPYRGYMSTMDDRAHFGVGSARRVDSLEVDWPDGRYQLLTNPVVDRLVIVKQADATAKLSRGTPAVGRTPGSQWFEPLDAAGLKYKHIASTQADFSVQPLLPYMISSHGPALAVADVNGDGLDDLFIGGGDNVPG